MIWHIIVPKGQKGKEFSVKDQYADLKMNVDGREIIIPCTEWRVDRPQRITIHKQPDEILRPLDVMQRFGGFRSRRLFFCRNVIVNFFHQL